MKLKLLIIEVFSLLLFVEIQGQQWIRIYGDSVNTVINTVFEHYDKGYIFSGERYNPGFTVYGWILKTDINGEDLWS
ncbi:MAG: hypothetical protein ABIK52_06680, partial [Bacteroidota bacterium]